MGGRLGATAKGSPRRRVTVVKDILIQSYSYAGCVSGDLSIGDRYGRRLERCCAYGLKVPAEGSWLEQCIHRAAAVRLQPALQAWEVSALPCAGKGKRAFDRR
jgi:hypothetical protein